MHNMKLIFLIGFSLAFSEISAYFTNEKQEDNGSEDVIGISVKIEEEYDTLDHPLFDDDKNLDQLNSRKSRTKRQASSLTEHTNHCNESSPRIKKSQFNLRDNNTNAYISWVGFTPDVVALTLSKVSATVSSNLYISNDYGVQFKHVVKSNISCLCVRSGGSTLTANIDRMYHASSGKTKKTISSSMSFMFTDTKQRLIVSTQNLKTFTTVLVPFTPKQISFHPSIDELVLCLAKDLRGNSKLYYSTNFGSSWTELKSGVKDFYWGWETNQLFVSVSKFFGIADIYDVKKLEYDEATNTINETTIISNVRDFQLKGSFLFASKPHTLFGNGSRHLNLFVLKRGSTYFSQAEFPFRNFTNLEFYVVDTEMDRVMITVTHAVKATHLYVSDVSGTRYTLSLPNLVYLSAKSTGSSRLLNIAAIADIYKIDGLKGIYIASQFLSNRTGTNAAQVTRITYDKGGLWTHIPAPYRSFNGSHTYCYWYGNCTLHLLQSYRFRGTLYRSYPPLSNKNAIGLVLATGVYGSSLKPTDTRRPSVFLSTNAGFTWEQVAYGTYSYSFGDHGSLIVMVPSGRLTNELKYKFYDRNMHVYGLLTEPGSKSSNFSLWGSESGDHSWVIVQLDLLPIYGKNNRCSYRDYRSWSPGVTIGKEICLLGEQEVIERKNASRFCYNNKNYERWNSTKICKCKREDFECDYGYILTSEKGLDIWNPQPHWHNKINTNCTRDRGVTSLIDGKPPYCPYGTQYNITRGYRKVGGDVCSGGEEHRYAPIERACPSVNTRDFIIYSSGTTIYQILLSEFTHARPVVLVARASSDEIYSVEYDYNNDILFWADLTTDSIKYFNVTGNYQRTLLSNNTGKVECISFDWENDNLYFVDSRTPKIELFTVLTHWRRTIISNNATHTILENPRALDLVPSHGIMFWTDWSGNDPRVMKSSMAGYNITKIISKSSSRNVSLFWPNGIAVDPVFERVYVIDGYTHTIMSSGFNGDKFRVVLRNHHEILHPFALAIYKQRLYWSDWSDHKIKSVLKDTGNGFYTLLSQSNGTRITALKLLNYDVQYKHNNTGCGAQKTTNGGCSNICVPHQSEKADASTNRLCLCPDNSKPANVTPGHNEPNCTCRNPHESFNYSTGYCSIGHGLNCSSSEFKCGNNRCIPARWRCDTDNDCGDFSDERNCPSSLCEPGQFLCHNTQKCISKDWLCDGDNDCGDHSDEEVHCDVRTCRTNQFQCDKGRCIPIAYKCDGESDCGFEDSSDEENCTYPTTPSSCGFRCNNSQCIPASWKCDGTYDCTDGSDEPSHCINNTCDTATHFRCNNSHCIYNAWLCDGDNDCQDMSDEANCVSNATTSASTIRPPPSWCICHDRQGHCVSDSARCDGYQDCPDNIDEEHCSSEPFFTTPAIPSSSPKYCVRRCQRAGTHENMCLTVEKICNGQKDCADESDETGCGGSCPPGSQGCAVNPSVCVFDDQICDGYFDCPYGTDEQSCSSGNTTCRDIEFQCNDGACISIDRQCDDRWDCADGSDEDKCSKQNVSVSNLRLLTATSTSATLRWNSSMGTLKSVDYLIEYRYVPDIHGVSQNHTWQSKHVVNMTTRTVDHLEPNSNYEFKVSIANKGVTSRSSNTLRMATKLQRPSNVTNLSATYEPGSLVVTWYPPVHTYGVTPFYIITVSVNGKSMTFSPVYPGDDPKAKITWSNSIGLGGVHTINITVFAVNRVGRGPAVSRSVCIHAIAAPQVSCNQSADDSITVNIHKMSSSTDSVRLQYIDIDRIPRYTLLQSGSQVIKNLSPGTLYNFTFSTHSPQDRCHSLNKHLSCQTTGNRVLPPSNFLESKNKTFLSWSPVVGAAEYQIVLANTITDFDEGIYFTNFTTKESLLNISYLLPCEVFVAAVKVSKPHRGPLSGRIYVIPKYDPNAAPFSIKIRRKTTHLFDYVQTMLQKKPEDDMVDYSVSWKSCQPKTERFVIYRREVNSGLGFEKKIPASNTISLQRGGEYYIWISADSPNAKNSTSLHLNTDPYEPPVFSHKENNDSSVQIVLDHFVALKTNELAVKRLHVHVLFTPKGKPSIDGGYKSINDTITIPRPYQSETYTVSIRYARKNGNKYYYGIFQNETIEVTLTQTKPSAQGSPTQIGMYAGIGVSALVVLILSVLLGVWCVRHRRLQRSFQSFTSSHYNSRTENATFDDDDSPMIQGFSDDEPLVIA